MKQRCLCPNDPFYERYGGRGIEVCKRWKDSFENFYEDMGPRPVGHVLDRLDNDGNYEPNNCRWVTESMNQRNRSTNRLLTFRGKTVTLVEWAEELGFNVNTLTTRLNKLGWSVERALTEPKRGT